jgi:hypothetical protein
VRQRPASAWVNACAIRQPRTGAHPGNSVIPFDQPEIEKKP